MEKLKKNTLGWGCLTSHLVNISGDGCQGKKIYEGNTKENTYKEEEIILRKKETDRATLAYSQVLLCQLFSFSKW